MADVPITPSVTKLAKVTAPNFAPSFQASFSLNPLGGYSGTTSTALWTAWVPMPCPSSALKLTLGLVALTGGGNITVNVETTDSAAVVAATPGSALLAGMAAMDHAAMPALSAAGQAYWTGKVGQYVRLKIAITGTSPTTVFAVTGTGYPDGLQSY